MNKPVKIELVKINIFGLPLLFTSHLLNQPTISELKVYVLIFETHYLCKR